MMQLDLLRNLAGSAQHHAQLFGVVVGRVTNNQDPEQRGRVKVKLPWMADNQESDWARVASPMAGNGRGIHTLPEVDDEVLVAFEHGDVRFAYVLGALWNGRDKPPETDANKRTIRSRSGHTIRLDDSDGAEKIEIRDGGGKTSIVLNTTDNSIVIAADADITIKSVGGQLKLDAQTIRVEAAADLTIKGRMVNIN